MKLMHKGEYILNVPNALSFYRLIIFPFILYLALSGNEKWFAIFICISLITDMLDGSIARYFQLQTKFGAALDNLADIATYIMALLGLFLFKWDDIAAHAWILYIFLFVFVLSYIISFVKFGKIPGLHLVGGVTTGYLQGIFFFILFSVGFYTWMYYIAIGFGIIAYCEKSLVLLRMDDIKTGVKGLYWLLKEQRR